MYLWFFAAAVSYFVKGLCGFANTLIFTSILSFGTANANISPIDLLLGYPANIILTWRNRKKLDPKIYLPLAGFVLAGSIPGALLLKHVDVWAVCRYPVQPYSRRKENEKIDGDCIGAFGYFVDCEKLII